MPNTIEKNKQIQQNKKEIAQLNEKQRNQINAKKQEINYQRRNYDNILAGQKDDASVRINQTISENQKAVESAISLKQDRLLKYKEETDKAINLLSDTFKKQAKNHELRMTDVKIANDEKMVDLYQNAKENTKKILDNNTTNIDKIKLQSETELETLNLEKGLKLYDAELDMKKSLDSKREEIQKVLNQNKTELQRRELLQMREGNKKIFEQKKQQTKVYKEREKIFMADIAKRDAANKKAIANLETSFQKRFKAIQEAHQEVLQGQAKKNLDQLNDLIMSGSTEMKTTSTKQVDPFYAANKIDPVIEDKLDHYIVSMPLPEHEQEKINVSPDGRLLKVNFARAARQTLRGPTGEVHTSRKSESVFKEIPVKDLMDAQKVTKSYENGIVRFKIMKA